MLIIIIIIIIIIITIITIHAKSHICLIGPHKIKCLQSYPFAAEVNNVESKPYKREFRLFKKKNMPPQYSLSGVRGKHSIAEII